MQQPKSFLEKVLYGLNQELWAWNARINGYLRQNDFNKCPYEHAIYMKRNHQGEFAIIHLYVNGLLYTQSSAEMLAEFKTAMFNELR